MAEEASKTGEEITMYVLGHRAFPRCYRSISIPSEQLRRVRSQDHKLTSGRNVKGPSELKIQITIAPTKLVSELKEAIASKSDVEKDRQRLIYSGMSCLHHAISTKREDCGIMEPEDGRTWEQIADIVQERC